jgi:hypothetical protein
MPDDYTQDAARFRRLGVRRFRVTCGHPRDSELNFSSQCSEFSKRGGEPGRVGANADQRNLLRIQLEEEGGVGRHFPTRQELERSTPTASETMDDNIRDGRSSLRSRILLAAEAFRPAAPCCRDSGGQASQRGVGVHNEQPRQELRPRAPAVRTSPQATPIPEIWLQSAAFPHAGPGPQGVWAGAPKR